MAFTKQHFEAVARVIGAQRAGAAKLAPGENKMARMAVTRAVAEGMADLFAAKSGRFDRERFLGACGVL